MVAWAAKIPTPRGRLWETAASFLVAVRAWDAVQARRRIPVLCDHNLALQAVERARAHCGFGVPAVAYEPLGARGRQHGRQSLTHAGTPCTLR